MAHKHTQFTSTKDAPLLGNDFKKRSMPNTKIRAKVAQKPVSDLPLFCTKREEQKDLL